MNTVVCVKQVSSYYRRHGSDGLSHRSGTGVVGYSVNPHDEAAIEEAVRIKEVHGSGQVTLLTLGAHRAEAALRWGLSLGADRGIHIVDEHADDLDPWIRACVLAKVIRDLDYHLLLFGRMALDDGMGQVGTYVAEQLNLPLVTAVAKLELSVSDGMLTAERVLDRGNREVVECPFPAVLTVDKVLNCPRYPSVKSRLTARTKAINRLELASLGCGLANHETRPKLIVDRIAPPKSRPKKILAPDSSMSAAARLQFVVSGGIAKKKGTGQIAGEPRRLAVGIFEFLREKRFL